MPRPTAQLDRKCEVLRATTTRDAAGGRVETYSTIATPWCHRTDTGGGETRSFGALHSETTSVFEMRWSSSLMPLTAKDRIRQEGRTWDVLVVREIGRRQAFLIQARERIGQV
jgi:SPP1 family predicted phage head-tail adaptor